MINKPTNSMTFTDSVSVNALRMEIESLGKKIQVNKQNLIPPLSSRKTKDNPNPSCRGHYRIGVAEFSIRNRQTVNGRPMYGL